MADEQLLAVASDTAARTAGLDSWPVLLAQ